MLAYAAVEIGFYRDVLCDQEYEMCSETTGLPAMWQGSEGDRPGSLRKIFACLCLDCEIQPELEAACEDG